MLECEAPIAGNKQIQTHKKSHNMLLYDYATIYRITKTVKYFLHTVNFCLNYLQFERKLQIIPRSLVNCVGFLTD